MSTPTEEESLQLSVSNFGPIAKAEIDLRRLTVFVGPSNTGKSYLAILIYALHKFFSRYAGSRYERRYAPFFIQNIEGNQIVDYGNLNYDNLTRIAEWIRSAYSEETAKADSRILVPNDIASMINPLFKYLNSYVLVIANEIKQGLGFADLARLIRYGDRTGAKITLQFKPFEYELELKRRTPIGSVSLISEGIPLYIDLHTEGMQEVKFWADALLHTPSSSDFNDVREDHAEDLLREFFIEVLCNVVNPLNNAAHYLPADRAGVMHAGRELIVSLIERASYPTRGTLFPTLPGALANFLQQLVDLDEPRGQEDLAANLEREILRGAIHIKKSKIGYPSFFYQPQGWREGDLPLMNTSSMVSELAPVVLYLRHIVQPGDVLIIEEPESHLHPKIQVEFIRQLATVVNAGVRVMLTTHSEWVLDELTNLVRLSDLPKTQREGIASADSALNPRDVGVWLFEPKQRPKGSVVKEIPFDEEFGGFRSGFDEVAMSTYNDYAKISNRIERSRGHDKSH